MPIVVARYDGMGGDYAIFPNLQFVHGKTSEGPRPSIFSVRYVWDATSTDQYRPWGFTDVLSTDVTSPEIVEPGDRLVILAQSLTDRPVAAPL